MSKITMGQNASGIILKTSHGILIVPKKCECSGVYRFNDHGEIECDKCGIIFE